MEYLNELIALGVDSLILGLCLKEYFSYKNTLDVLKVHTTNCHNKKLQILKANFDIMSVGGKAIPHRREFKKYCKTNNGWKNKLWNYSRNG